MIYKKLVSIVAASVFAALIVSPAQARFGGGGGFHGGGFHGGFGGFHGGGGFVRGPAFAGHAFMGRPAFARGAFVGRPAFARSAFVGSHAFARSAFVGRPVFVHRPFVRHAFFRHRHFVGPFVGAGFAAGVVAAGYSSCWTWVPTNFGWQQVWACGPDWGSFDWGW